MSTAGVRRTSPRRRRAGDDGIERIEALFRAEHEAMVRLAFTLVRNQAEAEELVQESFVEIHRRFDEIRQPGAYLRTAVVSHCRSALRRRRTMAERGPVRPDDLAPEARDLWDALDVLTDDQRIVVVLKFYGGYRASEIASFTGHPAATVRSHLRRGLHALREELDP